METQCSGLPGCPRRAGDGLPVREPVLPLPLDPAQPDDDLLDGWLASLTRDQLERMLESLARPWFESLAAAS